MRSFDHNRFDINSSGTENPWDRTVLERPDVDAPVKKSITSIPLVRFLVIVLLVALLLYFLYTVCVHPIHKLNLSLLLAKHCVIKITVKTYPFFGNVNQAYANKTYTLIVYIDENAFAIGDGYPDAKDLKYYKLVDGELYAYSEAGKQWYLSTDNDETDPTFSAEMFDRGNYKWAKGKLFVWQYKDRDIFFEHRFGNFKFTYNYGYGDMVIEFKRIGITHLDPPWDE